MKKIVVIFSLSVLTNMVLSQNINFINCKEKPIDERITDNINSVRKLIDDEKYFSAYNNLLWSLENVENYNQLDTLQTLFKELKIKCKTKPLNECECLQKIIDNGGQVNPQDIFFYDCKELLKEKP